MKKRVCFLLCAAILLALAATPALAIDLMRDPVNPDTIPAANFNFKESGGGWLTVLNPWGGGVYMSYMPSPGTLDVIVTFEITGYDGGEEGYRAMPGMAINGWITQVWSLDLDGADGTSWEEILGEKLYYYINGDGVYKMVYPMTLAMNYTASQDDRLLKEYLEEVVVMEIGIYGIDNTSTLEVKILDVEETTNSYSIEGISRPLDAPLTPSGETPPDPVANPNLGTMTPEGGDDPGTEDPGTEEPGEQPPEEPSEAPPEEPSEEPSVAPPEEPSEEPSDASPSPAAVTPPAETPNPDGDGGNGWIIWLVVGLVAAAGVIIAVVVVLTKKKKSK